MAKLLLGKEVNASINEEIKAKVETLKAQNITPVSYTHLDVYKRQVLNPLHWKKFTDR